MMALGRSASICATGIEAGTISEYTWHSRTLRAISCAYCAPKSTTRTVSGVSVPSPSGACTAASLVGLRGRLLGPRVTIGRGDAVHLAHPDPGDAPPVQLGHRQLPARDFHRLALAGQVPEGGQQIASDGLVRALGQLNAGLLGEVIQVQQAVDLQLAAAQLARLALIGVVLVLDLADQLLDQVLERHDARGAAVLVEHDCQVRALPP